jgi:ribonuclease P protein component
MRHSMVLCAAPRGTCHEAHLSTAQHSSCPKARLSRPHGDCRRPEGPSQSTPQGTEASRGQHLQEVSLTSSPFDRAPPSGRASGRARSRRVRKRPEFQYIQANGKRITTAHFILLVAAQPLASPASPESPRRQARLGIVASRRVGGAVVRNRVKRLCRECFRLSPTLLPAGVDLVAIPKRGSESMKLHEVVTEWAEAAPSLRRRAMEALAETQKQPHVSAGR